MRAVVTAYGKINLLLDVLRKRDDGFHEVNMIMQAVKLADYVAVKAAEENVLISNIQYLPTNQDNLAMKAVVLMQQEFPQLPPLCVNLEKYIPVAAGMAGGSSDCAATMMGINALFQLGLDRMDLMALGAKLGSDIPFCFGTATALATGRGEYITPLPDCPKLYLVLVKPRFGVSTAGVYKNLRAKEIQDHPDVAKYIKSLCFGDKTGVLKGMYNALERSTFELQPTVKEIKEQLYKEGAKHVLMSGSGPTTFAAFEHKDEAYAFYKKIKRNYFKVIFTETMDTSAMESRVKIYE